MDRPPLLELFTLGIMVLFALWHLRQGAFRAFLLLVNLVVAGLLAFNVWEPLATGLAVVSRGLDPYADALVLTALFGLCLAGLWLATLHLAPEEPALPPLARRGGSILFGLLSGYVTAGILICVLQTLPLPREFLWYNPEAGLGLGAPDRVWLAAMQRASSVVFDIPGGGERWFDADGSFIPRYARYRRRANDGTVSRNRGEFPSVLDVKPPPDASP
jgi:hypothetical protein